MGITSSRGTLQVSLGLKPRSKDDTGPGGPALTGGTGEAQGKASMRQPEYDQGKAPTAHDSSVELREAGNDGSPTSIMESSDVGQNAEQNEVVMEVPKEEALWEEGFAPCVGDEVEALFKGGWFKAHVKKIHHVTSINGDEEVFRYKVQFSQEAAEELTAEEKGCIPSGDLTVTPDAVRALLPITPLKVDSKNDREESSVGRRTRSTAPEGAARSDEVEIHFHGGWFPATIVSSHVDHATGQVRSHGVQHTVPISAPPVSDLSGFNFISIFCPHACVSTGPQRQRGIHRPG